MHCGRMPDIPRLRATFLGWSHFLRKTGIHSSGKCSGLVPCADHGTVSIGLSGQIVCQSKVARNVMKIVKLDVLHADGGWDTYSFLRITTDAGVVGWSEFNESRRRGMTGIIHGL